MIRFSAPSLEARALFFRKNYWRIRQILANLAQVATLYDQDSPAPLRIVLSSPPVHIEEPEETKLVLGFEEIDQDTDEFEAEPEASEPPIFESFEEEETQEDFDQDFEDL